MGGLSRQVSSTTKKWLIWYALAMGTLVFLGRANPMAFLPLYIQLELKQSNIVIGIIMALYPFASVVSTPWAARKARRTHLIVALHSLSVISMAIAMGLCAVAPYIQGQLGNTAAVVWLGLCRILQGVAASLYLSSNTIMLARKFPDELSYVIAMMQVASGAGGQMGRLVGGFLYDSGGLLLPFISVSIVQILFGIVGLVAFEDYSATPDTDVDSDAATGTPQSHKIPWSELISPRVSAGAFSSFLWFFTDNFTAAVLLQYLIIHLAPVTVGQLSLGMSARGLSYLVVSFGLAQVLHRQLLSFESLMITGCVILFCACNLLAPQPLIQSAEVLITGSEPSHALLWVVQVVSFCGSNTGGAFLFVPCLPLMQSDVEQHGQVAVEQVAELFVVSMSLGELLGPIFAGFMVETLGFESATFLLSLLFVFLFLLVFMVYDSTVIKARSKRKEKPPVIDNPDEDVSGFVKVMPAFDGESNFDLRRLPFAIDAKRHLRNVRGTAPPEVFRRRYVPRSTPLLGKEEEEASSPFRLRSESF